MEEMTLEQFREHCKKHDDNIITHEEAKDNQFKKNFILVCKKCGSTKVELFGANGVDYGEYTGYQSGEVGFKCKNCGNAISWDV